MTPSQLRRFLPKVSISEDGCWEWKACRSKGGYGMLKAGGGVSIPLYAHRASYEHFVGPIPDGLQIDHLCRNRACVNPSHLEPVTSAENSRRGEIAMRTHCPQGHPYDEKNTYWYRGSHRQCRACNLDRYYKDRDNRIEYMRQRREERRKQKEADA